MSRQIKHPMRRTWGGHSLLDSIKNLPLVRHLRRRRGLKFYLSERGEGLHYGTFRSFDEARSWLPQSKAFGRDEYTDEYVEIRTKRIYSFDYPMMFWLRRAFSEGARSIFDIGGSVGVHYYSYRPYLEYPDGLRWKIYELEACVVLGRELAKREGLSSLTFTPTLDAAAEGSDIWIAAGAIEFIEHARLDELIGSAGRKPDHILLNKMPMHAGADYVSTQNIGKRSFVPHYVYNRDRYVAGIKEMGYQLIDSWDVPERSFSVPGRPEESFGPYGGFYFRAA